MFSNIKTSKENKEVVTKLTNKFSLGAENIIARIAIVYSLDVDHITLEKVELEDKNGKEYSQKVLFGDYSEFYFGLICRKYGVPLGDKSIMTYLKYHLDKGLKRLSLLNLNTLPELIEELDTGKV